MKTVHSVQELRTLVASWHADSLKVGLVPTMGALHKGHLSLVDVIARQCDRVIVSVFVNPLQFGAHEDLGAYPRTLNDDCAKLSDTQCACVYAPSAKDMYPDGFRTTVHVADISRDFEGANRPGHFDGVATVVSKLLLQSGADIAIFGEKDWQQLAVIRRLVHDLDIDCTIIAGPLFREGDGLACSSRNVYLNPEQRVIAGYLNKALISLVENLHDHIPIATAETECKNALLNAGFDKVDYVNVVNPDTLAPISSLGSDEVRVVAAARLGRTRLLDTMPVRPRSSCA